MLDTVFVIGFKVVTAAVDLINLGLDDVLPFEGNVGLCDSMDTVNDVANDDLRLENVGLVGSLEIVVDIKLGLGLFVVSKERTGTL